MQKKFRINVDGRIYNVVVDDMSGEAASLHAAFPPAPIASAPVAAVPVPAAAPVAAPEPAGGAGAGAGAEVAPLGGVVVSIDVKTGQAIKAGDKVAIIEAMKMKTDVVAKNTGVVGNILVRPSDSIETGQALFTLV